jgi:hypothetical protein
MTKLGRLTLSAAGAAGAATTARPFCDGLVGFRLDLEPAEAQHRSARTLATDYEPIPVALLDVVLETDDAESALAAIAPRLRDAARIARPAAMRRTPRNGDATLRLHAAIVRAPLVAREQTSAAEIAAQLTGWREITTFGWEDRPGRDIRRCAYELLARLDIAS